MNDDINTKIHITAQNDASAAILKLVEDTKRLVTSLKTLAAVKVDGFGSDTSKLGRDQLAAMRQLKQRWAFEQRMSRQREGEAQDEQRRQETLDRMAMRSLRERMSFAAWMHAQRLSDERDLERERDRYHRDALRRGREALSSGRGAVRDTVRTTGTAAIAGTLATGAAARRALGVESAIDAAEINTRSYAGLSADMARKLRDGWAAPLAEALGTGTDKLLTAWTDAVKLGVPAEGAKGFAELATKTSSAWEVPFERVTDIMGTVNTLLTSGGEAFDIEKLKSVSNTLQHLAAKQSTTPEKMISFLQRGAGAAQVLGMSQEAGLAFGSASTSLGNQSGASGRLFDYVASRLIELPRLTRQHGDEGRQARQLLGALGYGSASAVEAKRRSDPDAFLPDFMDRFNRIKDKKKQDEAIRFFAGREWLGEFGRMVKGVDTYREAVRLSKEAKSFDAISQVWDLHRLKLSFVFKQFKTGWQNILGEFGKELSPLARQAGDFFLGWTDTIRKGGLSARFKAALEGLIEGFGFKNLPDMLKGIFGEPGKGDAGAVSAWRDTFREFAAGIKDIFTGIRDAVSAMAGGSPEVIARWTGRILALTAALVILSPVIGVIGTLASALIAIGAAVVAVSGSLRAAGLMGSAAGIAGAAGSKGKGLGALGRLFGIVGAAELANQYGALKMPDFRNGIGRAILEALDPGLASRILGPRKGKPGWQDPPARVQKQSSIEAKPDTAIIQKASFERIERSLRGVDENLRRSSGLIQLAALGGGEAIIGRTRQIGASAGSSAARAGIGAGAIESAVPGQRLPSFGMGRSGIIRRGAMGGLGSATGSGSGSVGNGLYDAIIRAEGTAKRGNPYDEVLGYGAYGRPSKPLSTMTLAEVHAHGLKMRQAQAARGTPWNRTSSASGAFQIVGSTMQDAARALGMDWNSTTFSPETQKRMAAWIARRQGLGAWEGFRTHPADRAVAADALRSGNLEGSTSASGSGGSISARIAELRRSGAISSAQCVALAKAYVGAPESVTSWRRGDAADQGGLRAGTPIATFLNRDGSLSNRYAGGGTGTPGANLDHAGVFDSYIKDKDGKNIGMKMFDQWAGRTGSPALRSYYFGDGWGEKDARNYFAIKNSRGEYLGGGRNPMSGASDDMKSSGWKPGAGNNTGAISGQAQASESERMMKYVPPPAPSTQGSGLRASSGRMHAPITIQGGNQDPQQIALAVQRHLNDTMNGRSHDIDYQTT